MAQAQQRERMRRIGVLMPGNENDRDGRFASPRSDQTEQYDKYQRFEVVGCYTDQRVSC